jgi:hypothetical protein
VNIVVYHLYQFEKFSDLENSMDQVMIHLCIFHVEDQMSMPVVLNEPNVDHGNYFRLDLAIDKPGLVLNASPKSDHVV